VATAALNPSDIATPLRSILRRPRTSPSSWLRFESVDLAGRRLVLDDGPMAYDALVLAAGAGHSYFGHDDWEPLAPSLKTLEDALEIRRRVLVAYEDAERERDGAEQRALLTSVVIGGGPTGVELAGALAEISRETIARDFRLIDPTKARIVLLEGGPRILAAFPDPLPARAAAALTRIGVEVRTGATVTRVTSDAVWLGGEQIRAAPCCGPREWPPPPLSRTLGVRSTGPVGCSSSATSRSRAIPRPSPSATCARSPRTTATRSPAWPRSPCSRAAWPPATCCTTSPASRRKDSTTETAAAWPPSAAPPRWRGGAPALSGLPAWLAWLFVHITFLIGFRNRFLVLFEWAWAYLSWQRGARLITGPWRSGSRH